MTAYPNFDAKHNLTITQANSFGSTEYVQHYFDHSNIDAVFRVTGTSPQQLRFPNARVSYIQKEGNIDPKVRCVLRIRTFQLITIDFQNMKGDQGFLLRYSSTGPSKWTTTLPTSSYISYVSSKEL